MPMPESNRRQAMVPRGARVLPNARGSAPGLWIDHADRLVLLLPGPPRELRPMLTELVEGPLKERGGGVTLVRRMLRVAGRIESHVDEKLHPLYGAWEKSTPPVAATILASLGSIELHVSTRATTREAAADALEAAIAEAVAVLGPDVYSTDGRSLEAVVGDLLVERGLRIGVAESCTGGLIASRLTDVPGSSRYVDQAVVVYSNEAKFELLGVQPELIRDHGAVSEPVGLAMASGIKAKAHAGVGVGVTGIAGPWWRIGREARRHGCRGGRDRRGSARANVSVLWRTRTGQVPGVTGCARHGEENAAGVRLFVAVEIGPEVQRAASRVIEELKRRTGQSGTAGSRDLGEARASAHHRSVHRSTSMRYLSERLLAALERPLEVPAVPSHDRGHRHVPAEAAAARDLGRHYRRSRQVACGRARSAPAVRGPDPRGRRPRLPPPPDAWPSQELLPDFGRLCCSTGSKTLVSASSQVGAVTLFESRLSSTGPTYVALGRTELGHIS